MDMLFSRKYIDNPQNVQGDSSVPPFFVASYNILADCHALPGVRDWAQYKWTTEDKLTIQSRHARLLKELVYLDADVYCLQEVSPSYFKDVLLPAMSGSKDKQSSKKYDGVFMKRQNESFDEGEAIIFRKERFELVDSQGVWLQEFVQKELDSTDLSTGQKQGILDRLDSPAVALLAKLKCKVSGTDITVGNIHVDFGFLIKDDVRCVQISGAIKALVKFAGGQEKAHIIAGDFNSVPDCPAYQLATKGSMSGDCLAHLEGLKEIVTDGQEKTSLISLWRDGFQHPSSSLKSSYFTVQGVEPPSSVFPHDQVLRAVDYIWFSSAALDIHSVLEPVPPAAIESGIPNSVAPSDHLSVKASFSFK